MKPEHRLVFLIALALLAGCGEGHSETKANQDTGPTPLLVEPRSSLIPTVDIAPAIGWPAQGKPTAAAGFVVNAFANGLDHPRTVYVLPTEMCWSRKPTHRPSPTMPRASGVR